ncbi:hypothetical protein KCH_26790 [Kitasatospora cheerisanensis KCTC 2395]|uniref:Uncharacterized protein n=1 Tax=Kitasatospora cheerisanensis KCTC 2395 TaxID=1348663 RepID=A0A066YV73_9ACTN|nr:hypothetical protein KCH_26790 [Kitasatospora cheerisanensis KCTC 2395]
MTMRDRGPEAADVQTLRAELDELLRARQFAAQRERRLSEELRAVHEPDRTPGAGHPPRQPDPELLRQLAHAQNLREGLGARCLELSDRLLAAEDRLLAERPINEPPRHMGRSATRPATGPAAGPAASERADRPTGWDAPLIPPQRPHSPGARFDANHHGEPAAGPRPERPGSIASALPNRPRPADDRTGPAARQASWDRTGAPGRPVGDPRPTAPTPDERGRRTVADSWNPRTATAPSTTPADRTAAPAAQSPANQHDNQHGNHPGNDRFRPPAPGHAPAQPNSTPPNSTLLNDTLPNSAQPNPAGRPTGGHPAPAQPRPGGSPGPAAPAQPSGPVRGRTVAELTALTQRISGLHQQGAAQESAAIVRQVAVMITPEDVTRLAALLQKNGPAGSSTYLARSAAAGAPEHAAATLAELRREGLIDEAADLFHTLWSASSAALPALLAALEQSGQSADGQTLLWERASAPADELAELAQHLRAAGRTDDVRNLLRQAAGRPINEVAAIAGALTGETAAALVGELVRLRSASDIGRFGTAIRGAAELYDTLLFAVDDLEESRARSAFAALRSAGLPTEPAPRPRSRSRQRR